MIMAVKWTLFLLKHTHHSSDTSISVGPHDVCQHGETNGQKVPLKITLISAAFDVLGRTLVT